MSFESYKEELQIRSSIVKWSKELYDNEMVKGSGGNISIKLNEYIIFTPTGYFLGHLTMDCLSKTDLKGNLIDGMHPTKEVPMHLAAYQSSPETNAVVHTHSIYATALASLPLTDDNMPIYLPSVISKVGNVKILEFENPGSIELANAVTKGLKNNKAVLLANHGIISTGRTIEEAISIAYEIEGNAKLHFITDGKCKPIYNNLSKKRI